MQENKASNGGNNVAIGPCNTGCNISSGDYNVHLGYKAGGGSTSTAQTGAFNITIGTDTAQCLTTGAANILMGTATAKAKLHHWSKKRFSWL